jgi:hypothetical protein
MKPRLPVGAIIRHESTYAIYVVLKVSSFPEQERNAYDLCCIYDPREDDQTQPLTFHYITDQSKNENYTVLNGSVTVDKQGIAIYTLDTINDEHIDWMAENEELMLRYITAIQYFSKDKKEFEVLGVSDDGASVMLVRDTRWAEKVVTGASFLGFDFTWTELLEEFKPHFPDDLDEQSYIQMVSDNVFF